MDSTTNIYEEDQKDEKSSQKVVPQNSEAGTNYLQSLFELFQKYGQDNAGKSDSESASAKEIDRQRFGNSFWMKMLLTYPYVLVVLFIFSFYWDFPSDQATIWGYTLHFEGLMKIITVSGLIGYGTNWLAITMLFRPLKKRPILGQGLIPAQKERIAFRLAQAVSRDLINPDLIKARISDVDIISMYRKKTITNLKSIIDNSDFREELKELLVWYVKEQMNDEEFRNSLTSSIMAQLDKSVENSSFDRLALKAYFFLRGNDPKALVDDALKQIPDVMVSEMGRVDELLDALPDKIEYHSESIETILTELIFTLIGELDVHELIEDNIMKLEEGKLEALIKGTTNEQLQYIQYLGAVLGTIGGLVIWEPVISIVFMGALTLAIVGLDKILMDRKSAH